MTRLKASTSVLQAVALFALTAQLSGAQTTWYVDDDNCPGGSGTAPDPFCLIQDAINASVSGDSVFVAPGTYSENIDFQSKDLVVLGLLGAAETVIDGQRLGSVVRVAGGQGPQTLLEGFTIQNGLASRGGGIYIDGASPIVRHCWIQDNEATNVLRSGGGLYLGNSDALITDNEFRRNRSFDWGGAILCDDGGVPTIHGNLIEGNVSFQAGGIFCADNSSPRVVQNLIRENIAGQGAGGVWCHWDSTAVVDSNVIVQNTAVQYGGGLIAYSSVCTITNNVIALNSALEGGGAWCAVRHPTLTNNTFFANDGAGGAVFAAQGSQPSLYNNIAWANTPEQLAPGLSAEHCNVQGGYPGIGNIDTDPLFVDPTNLDFHLQPGSPCVDAGSTVAPYAPDHDLEGDPRPVGASIDIGADELTFFLKAVTPDRGRYDAGTACVLIGAGFQLGTVTEVLFGDMPATGVQVISDTEIHCSAPFAGQGPVAVTVVADVGDAVLDGGFAYTPAVTPGGDWRPGGTIDLTYLISQGDSLFAIYGFDPQVDLETPGYDGTLCILPFWRAFIVFDWPSDEWSQTFGIPDDPNLSGLEFLLQGLAGPSFGPPKDAAWTNCGRVIIE